MKCEICKEEFSPECTWRQGRCPNQMPLVGSGLGLFFGYVLAVILFVIMLYGFAKILHVIDVLY